MARQGLPQQLFHISICLIAFSIPFPFIYGTISIVLATLLWLLQGKFKETWIAFWQRKLLWPLVLFYLLHAVSYLYSTDKANSVFDLQLKASLVIFPLIIGAGINISPTWLERILLSFIGGVAFVSIYAMGGATLLWFKNHETEQFFYHALVKDFSANAVYMSWYVIFSIACLLYFSWSNPENRLKRYALSFLVILLTLFLLLLSSRTLIVLFFGMLFVIFLIKRGRVNLREKTLYIIAVIATLIIAFTNNPIKRRYREITPPAPSVSSPATPMATPAATPAITANEVQPSPKTIEPFNNLTLRLFVWKLGFENIKEHHLWAYGAGNGDVQLLQNKKLYENGITNIYSDTNRSNLYNINLHNMYIQTLFMLGIPGLICFLIIVLSPILMYIYHKNNSIFLFLNIISIIFMLQESVLQTQAGILYYTFFLTIFWNIHYQKLYLVRVNRKI